jgi:hypothetical protein
MPCATRRDIEVDDVGDLVVDGVDTEEAVTEAGQPLTGEGQGLGRRGRPRSPGRRGRPSRIASAWPPMPSVPSTQDSPCGRTAPERAGPRCGPAAPERAAGRHLLRCSSWSFVHRRVSWSTWSWGGGWWCVDPAAGPHPIRARRGGSRVGIGSAGGRRSGRCAGWAGGVRVLGPTSSDRYVGVGLLVLGEVGRPRRAVSQTSSRLPLPDDRAVLGESGVLPQRERESSPGPACRGPRRRHRRGRRA